MYYETKKPICLGADENGDVKEFTIGFNNSVWLCIKVKEWNVYHHYGEQGTGDSFREITLSPREGKVIIGAKLFDFRKCEIEAILKEMKKMALSLCKHAFEGYPSYHSSEVATLIELASDLNSLEWNKPAWAEEKKE